MSIIQTIAKPIVIAGLTLSMIGCNRAPEIEDDIPLIQDDIPLFQDFIAENINKTSDDPYISSTVKPGDKLYPFLLQIQNGFVQKEIYEPLIESGDSESKLWYARFRLYNTKLRGKVYQWIVESMEAGNPYAALELSEEGEFCQIYGKGSTNSKLFNLSGMNTDYESKLCLKEYFTLAMEGFERLAKSGDLRAQYFLLKQKKLGKSKETRAEYIKEVIRFAENHYYQPLMDYVSRVLYDPTRPRKDKSNTPEEIALATELLTIASNHNYIPAIIDLIWIKEKRDKDDPLYTKLLNLGSPHYYKDRFIFFKNEYTESEKICFSFALKKITGGKTSFSFRLNEESRKRINELQADCEFKETPGMVYIDAFNFR